MEDKSDDTKEIFYEKLERALDLFLVYHAKTFLGNASAKIQ
jgi:hypothetical protein